MSGTKKCKLSELITIQNGYAFASKKFTGEGGMPLIRIRDLKNGTATQTNYSGDFDEAYLVNSGDLLIGMDGEFRCYEWKGSPALLNQRVCRIQNTSDAFDLKYLYYGINSYLKAIEDVTGYTTVKHLSSSTILNIEFPLPSLEKQREIVEKLNGAFTEIDLLEQNLGSRTTSVENLQAALLSSFFDLNEYEAPSADYSFNSLGSVSSVKGGKRLPKGTKWSPIPTSYPYIRVTDMKNGRINEDKLVFVPDEIRPSIKNYTVNTGDLIISIAGTIGEIAVVPDSLDKASLTENAARIILQKDKLDPEYCSYFLRSPVCRREIDSLIRTTTQPKLALFRIESLRIPVPSLKKQGEIVKRLDSAFAEIETLRAQISREKAYASSLRQSLLSSAFTQEEAVA